MLRKTESRYFTAAEVSTAERRNFWPRVDDNLSMRKALVVLWLAGCGAVAPTADGVASAYLSPAQVDAAVEPDGAAAGADAARPVDTGADAAGPECEWGGAPGSCMTMAACAAIADHTLETGSCATGLGCCIDTPDVADNPPIPSGYHLLMQSQVTPAMTNWAVMILHDPVGYPMFSTTMMTFGAQAVLARVEWHPPDFQNHIVHRGVTLYAPN